MAEVAKEPAAHAPGACRDTSCWISSACHLRLQPALPWAALTLGMAVLSRGESSSGPTGTPPGSWRSQQERDV